MAEKFEFASPGWLAFLQQSYEEAVASAGPAARDAAFTMCEVYTGVPAHLAPSGRLAWSARVRNGAVDFKLEEDPEADVHVTVDYTAVLPLGRLVIGDDANAQAEMNRLAGEAIKAGKFVVRGDPSKRPAFLAGIHDAIANVTA